MSKPTTHSDKNALLQSAFAHGLAAVMPETFMANVAQTVMACKAGRPVHILSVGKAAGAMAHGYFAAGGEADSALIILPDSVDMNLDSPLPTRCKTIASAHPVPNEASEDAARAALYLAEGLGAGDILVMLLSGGGSSLMSLGLGDITLADKQNLNASLLASGIAIQEMNIIRKHVSAIKGGRLAVAATPAQIMTFAISDVPGDAPDAIASGPVSGDDSTREHALEIIEKHNLILPETVMKLLKEPECESPFCDDARLKGTSYEIVASAKHALEASAKIIEEAGYQTIIMGDGFQEDTVALADIMEARLADEPNGTALISGGEASVKIEKHTKTHGTGTHGTGGRNAQFALEMARRNLPDICGIACDTDGIDGRGLNAGALFYHGLSETAEAQGVDIEAHYERYDSHSFFEAMGCHIKTGPTQTNVNDLRIILKGAPLTQAKKA